MKRSEILFGLLRIPVDLGAMMLALFAAYNLRINNIDLIPGIQLLGEATTLPPINIFFDSFMLPGSAAFILLTASLSLYSLRITLGPWREMGRVITAAVLWLVLIIAWYFLIEKQLFYSRVLLLQSAFLAALFVIIGRTIVTVIQRMLLRYGIGIRVAYTCGKTNPPVIVQQNLTDDPRFSYQGHITSAAELIVKQKEWPIDLIIHTDAAPGNTETTQLVECCRSHQIGYAFLPPVFADVPRQLSFEHLGLTPILRFVPTPLDGWGRVLKRTTDLIVALILTVILSPILLLISLLILLTCGWPIFYVSTRTGQYGRKKISLIKFRSMCKGADKMKPDLAHLSHRTDGPLFKIKDDPRVTTIGKFLRRWSLDELPQLFNVIAGHLSLVGPRPHLPEEVARYSEAERRVFTVRPGATGLAQISGRSGLTFQDEVRLDMQYIEEWSLGLDLWILWRTVFVVLSGREAD